MSYVRESDIRVKIYDNSNFSWASVVQFRVSRYIMSQIRTFVWKVMTIRISRELPLFIFERLDELCTRIGHPCEKLWPFEFLESFRCSFSSVSMSYVRESDILVKSYDHSNFSSTSIVQFRASRYITSKIRTSVWKVMTIRISRKLPFFNFERLDELCTWIGHPCEKLWPFKYLECFHCAISSVSIYYIPQFRHPCEKLWPFEFLESFRCSMSSVSMSYVRESDIRVKSYGHSNILSASVVQFRESRYVMSPNSDIRVKSNDHLNF